MPTIPGTISATISDEELSALVDYGMPINSAPDYTVNKSGDVFRHTFKNKVCYKRLETPIKLKPKITNKGYLSVGIWSEGKKTDSLVHRLVMLAYGGPQPDGHEVAHRNGVRSDPRLENLRWATHADNQNDMVAHGTMPDGERNGSRVLSAENALEIAKFRGLGPASTMAKRYGVSRSTILLIWKGRRWSRTLKANGFTVSEATT